MSEEENVRSSKIIAASLAVLVVVLVSVFATRYFTARKGGEVSAQEVFVPNAPLTLVSYREEERDPVLGRMYVVLAARNLGSQATLSRASRRVPVNNVKFVGKETIPRGTAKLVVSTVEGQQYATLLMNPLRRASARPVARLREDRGQGLAYGVNAPKRR